MSAVCRLVGAPCVAVLARVVEVTLGDENTLYVHSILRATRRFSPSLSCSFIALFDPSLLFALCCESVLLTLKLCWFRFCHSGAWCRTTDHARGAERRRCKENQPDPRLARLRHIVQNKHHMTCFSDVHVRLDTRNRCCHEVAPQNRVPPVVR